MRLEGRCGGPYSSPNHLKASEGEEGRVYLCNYTEQRTTIMKVKLVIHNITSLLLSYQVTSNTTDDLLDNYILNESIHFSGCYTNGQHFLWVINFYMLISGNLPKHVMNL